MAIFERPSVRRQRRQEAVVHALAAVAPLGMSAPDLGRVTGIGFPKVYVPLAALEREGLVTSWWVHNWNAAVPPRRRYGLDGVEQTGGVS